MANDRGSGTWQNRADELWVCGLSHYSGRARIEIAQRAAVDWNFPAKLSGGDGRKHAREFAVLDPTSAEGQPAHRDAGTRCHGQGCRGYGGLSLHDALSR